MSTFWPIVLFWRTLACTVDLAHTISFVGAVSSGMKPEISAESMPMMRDSSKYSLFYFIAKAGRGDCQPTSKEQMVR